MTSSDPGAGRGIGGIVHTYLAYDPKNFPSPTAPPPDVAGAAFEHMLAYGSTRDFTEEELANAVRLDPSMFPRLGPSLEALQAMLRERKERILRTYETSRALESARAGVREEAKAARPPKQFEGAFRSAVREEQIAELERLWYRQKDDSSEFAAALVRMMERLGEKYQVEELAAKYEFTGATSMDVPTALAVKEELEAIDELLRQLEEARKNAQLAIIDMEALAELTDADAVEGLNQIQQQIEDYLREEARRQGLEKSGQGYALSPQAYRLFQRKLLQEIFAELEASRSGRHTGPVVGEGAVELERTKAYEFGDPVTGVDIGQSIANAAARGGGGAGLRVTLDDLEIHRTRNTPRCASAVLLDMSGSMRYGGQFINCKRMALALDGLIRSEYPGDFLAFFEMYTFAKRRAANEVPALMPKPVTIQQPVVRLKADMADEGFSELRVPQHFTNIQHALRLARQVLSVQETPNRQIMLITDGLPTAHFEGSMLYMLYPADQRTEAATMREARLCAKEGITINIFLLPSWSQGPEDIQFAHRLAEETRGRVFFTGGKDLDRFVLWDYVRQRRRIIA